MKIKVISGVLIFSLALNLAVIGTFVFKRFLEPDRNFERRDKGGRQFLREFEDEERAKIRDLFKEFRNESRQTMEQIRILEDELFEALKQEDSDLPQAYKIMDKIAEKRLTLGKVAVNQFLKAKTFLSPEQRNHFYRMMMKNKPGHKLRKPPEEIFKERKKRMENRRQNKNDDIK